LRKRTAEEDKIEGLGVRDGFSMLFEAETDECFSVLVTRWVDWDPEEWILGISLMQHDSRNPEKGRSLTLLTTRWSKDGQERGRE